MIIFLNNQLGLFRVLRSEWLGQGVNFEILTSHFFLYNLDFQVDVS